MRPTFQLIEAFMEKAELFTRPSSRAKDPPLEISTVRRGICFCTLPDTVVDAWKLRGSRAVVRRAKR